jgi:hypothetical protein
MPETPETKLRDYYGDLIETLDGAARGADDLRRQLENSPPAENQPIQLATGVARIRDILRVIVKYELHRFRTWETADKQMQATMAASRPPHPQPIVGD